MTPEDRAQALELAEYERTQQRALLPVSTQPSAEVCEECDAVIPEARRKIIHGVRLCVDCQERLETLKRLGK